MKTIQQSFSITYSFPVIFTRDAFGAYNTSLSDVLRTSGQVRNRVLIVGDSNLINSNPDLLEKIERYGQRNRDLLEFVDTPFIIRGGEICKNEPQKGQTNSQRNKGANSRKSTDDPAIYATQGITYSIKAG